MNLLRVLRPAGLRGLLLLAFLVARPAEAIKPHPLNPLWDCSNLLAHGKPIDLKLIESARTPENASFAEISRNWTKVRKELWEHFAFVDASIDARRLINVEDWEDALRDMPESPWFKYGREPISNFYAVVFLVRRDAAGLDVDGTLLQFLHRWAMRDLPFHGFEGRRLVQRFRRGEITNEQLKALLKRAYEGNEQIAGVRHNDLIGTYRYDPIDEIEHRGSSFDANKNRYFTLDELVALRKNPYLRVDEASLKPRPEGGFTGVVRYYPVKGIEKVVEAEIAEKVKRMDKAFAFGIPNPDLVAAVVELERNLIAIHPFLDGNGRSIRAFTDLIYYRHGLPTPLSPNESDLVMSTAESVEYVRKEMIKSINAWIDSAKKGLEK